MRPPRLCCGIKHTKNENLPPYAPQSIGFYLLSLFSSVACPPLPGGCRAATRPSGRERNPDALGAIIYYIVIQLVLTLGFDANLLKLLSASVVAVFLAVPYWKGKYFSKPVKKAKEDAKNA